MVVSFSLKNIGKFIGLIILMALFFIGGIALQRYFSTHQASSVDVSKASPTPSPIPLKDPILIKQAQDGFTQFLNYMKTTGTQDMKLTDYNNLKLDQIYMKGAEIHAIFIADLFPANSGSSQNLVIKGGALQKDGWIPAAKAYIILTKQGNNYDVHEISFSLPNNF